MKNSYPDNLLIQQYLEGSLDPETMHQLEEKSLEDPFLWEALEGYSDHSGAAAGLSILQRQLHERIVHLQENKKVFDLTWQRLSIAAASAVLFILAGILFWMNSQRSPEKLASGKQVEVNAIHPDSLSSVLSEASPVVAENRSANLPQVSAGEADPGIPDSRARIAASSAGASAATVSADSVRPETGWDLFNQYLRKEASKFRPGTAGSGRVLVSVTVNGDGKLTEVKTVRGYNDTLDKEAIRIVKEGPQWLGAADGQAHEALVEVIFEP